MAWFCLCFGLVGVAAALSVLALMEDKNEH